MPAYRALMRSCGSRPTYTRQPGRQSQRRPCCFRRQITASDGRVAELVLAGNVPPIARVAQRVGFRTVRIVIVAMTYANRKAGIAKRAADRPGGDVVKGCNTWNGSLR